MSLYKIGSYVLAFVLLGAVVGLTLAQRDDSFVFPDQVPEKSPGFDSPDLAQMLEIAQKLNDMDSVDDVLKYVEGVPESNLRSPSRLPGPVSEQDGPILQGGLFHSRIGGDGEERSKAEQPLSAKCEPELQPVTLKVDNDPSKFYYPSCTRIHRCGGCCSHSLLACEPVETNVRNFEVMVMSLVGRKLRYQDKRIVPLEEHTKCKCGCRIKAEHCNERQSYINAECRCACNNVDEAAKCIKNSTKVWNPDRCVCLCRDEQECSTGFYFDQNTCRCKQVLLSKTWFQPTRGTDYRFAQTQKPDNVPPVIVPLDAADPRRKPKDDPEY
ncbi:PDGF- and VEGF-related factor 1 isoform X1 [Nomia melanderi]|uniref:PDGF- and VEGF-related factor 1 isoform X1 n=1 Tax=Nomia melanderi TaxID=2448451 RepID=UPI003FCD95F6